MVTEMKATSTKSAKQDWSLLKQLCEIHAPSGEEKPLRDFLLQWIKKEKKKWKVQPTIVVGEEFQDCIILKFGKPRTAIFAHMDSIGFTVRYFNQLLSIGSPDAEMGTKLNWNSTKKIMRSTNLADPSTAAPLSPTK
jgi:hypothetical protein